MGVIVGVAVIRDDGYHSVAGLQRNLLSRFKALDLFSEMTVFGKASLWPPEIWIGKVRVEAATTGKGPRLPTDFTPTRIPG